MSLKNIAVALLLFTVQPAMAAPPSGVTPNQSWEDALKSIETLHQGLRDPNAVQERLFTPATNENVEYKTMDGSQQFKAAYTCRTSNPVLIIKGTLGAAGELSVQIEYSAKGNETTSSMRATRIAGACVGGAVFECSPPGSWTKCKYGAFEFQNNNLVLSHTYAGGVERDPVGMRGCFCFSDYCGGTGLMYMETILRHMGQGIVDQILAANRNLVVAEPTFDEATATMTWYSGNVDDCTPLGAYDIAELTSQYGRMDLDYQSAINKQEVDSPWDILTKNMDKPRNQYYCSMKAKASSEFRQLLTKIDASYGIGWDADGSSKDCYWFQGGSCGHAFGEPRSWEACLSQATSNFSRICNELYVKNGHFTSISHIANPRAVSGLGNYISCYGSGNDGYDQMWTMECWGYRYEDYFICNSSNKSRPGTTILNDPYNLTLYDGCSEIREVDNGCAQLEAREGCYIINEKTDNIYTILNTVNTGIEVPTTCREIRGVRSSIVVCEPWWEKERKYECPDMIDGFEKEKERAGHVTQNIVIDDNKYLSTVGDLQFGADGQGVRKVIDANIQFDNQIQACTPACIVQQEVPNYTLVIPGQRQTGENPDEHIGDYVEPSIVPGGTTTLIKTLDCVESDNMFTCPVEQGWSLRAQCSCADGAEFANAISLLMALNEASKDLICSSGNPAGVCDSEDEGVVPYRVLCGDFDATAQGLITTGEVWDCSPKLWRGTQIPNQTHLVTVDDDYHCQVRAEDLPEDDNFENDLGPLVPQKDWFDEALVWAKTLIARDLQTAADSWYSTVQCDCPGFTNEIDVCQPVQGSSNFTCLTNSQQYGSYGVCSQGCPGRATSDQNSICLWENNLASISDASIFEEYALSLQPDQEALFGEVSLKGTFTTSIFKADPMPTCNQAGTEYVCSSTTTVYASLDACTAGCRFQGVTNARSCASATNTRGYSLYLKKNGNSLVQALDFISLAGTRERIQDTAYNYQSRIVQQCVDRHVTPYISFTEPGTNAHFEVSHAGMLAYQYAAKHGHMPSKNGLLPDKPAVYRGSALRAADINDQRQHTDEVDDNGNVTSVPDFSLTPEELEALANARGDTTVGSDGLTKPINGNMLVPRAPMFFSMSWSSLYQQSGPDFGNIGGARVSLSSLQPYVYYYECPKGTNTASSTNTCGGKTPFGGVVDTIAGKWCMQFHCDESAMADGDASQYSGCGLVNDGWK